MNNLLLIVINNLYNYGHLNGFENFTFSEGFHFGGNTYSLPKQTIPRHLVSYHSGNNCA